MKKANPVWRVILGLSRYGGLRTPSETLSLRWDDIDWELNRMSIPEPKVEHHERRGVRSCPIFPRASTDPRRSVRDLRGQERIRGRRTSVPRRRQHGDGLEERKPTQRDDATAAPRRRLGLAAIVPFDAGQQTDGTATRVPAARGLFVAWQLTTDRAAELLAGYRG
jgi:integrase